MKSNRFARLAVALLAPLLAAGALIAQAGAASATVQHHGHHHGRVLYVSPEANPGNSDRSCQTAAFATIQSAVNAARSGGTVVVCSGTYHEQVVVSKPLTLVGKQAIIDEAGVTPTFQVTLPGLGPQTIYAAVILVSSRITFTGFTVQNAQGEGVLAAGLGGTLRGIVISRNVVANNDLGAGIPPKSPYFQCAAMGEVPGDCGEGVHLAGGVAYSSIRDNLITGNSGGVLLSDDVGPTHNNVVADNIVTGNLADCGITVPGHNPNALNDAGVPQPQVAGVYANVIRGNVVTDNGTEGEGAGVLFANAGPGTASYDNLVQDNYIEGNGLSGVTMHAHTIGPGQFEDLNGNVIVGNAIGKNNLDGDTLDGPPGPEDLETTGVLVFSDGIPVTVKIARNLIFNNSIGIWLSAPVTASGLKTNTFLNVTTPISANN
jgi:nitrous oxidase accessory protein NosD